MIKKLLSTYWHKLSLSTYWHMPIITTRTKRFDFAETYNADILSILKERHKIFIEKVVAELERLRNDTWNQDAISRIQESLKENFGINEDDKQSKE